MKIYGTNEKDDADIGIILHAALTTMVKDNHACQDALTESQWGLAEFLWAQIDHFVNSLNRQRPE